MRRILTFAAVVEIGTAVVLLVAPGFVAVWLLGAELTGIGAPIGRCFGIALLALGVACWPGAQRGGDQAFRAMCVYNALIALYLGYLGALAHQAGPLLWPAAALHAGVALWLVRARRDERQAPHGRQA